MEVVACDTPQLLHVCLGDRSAVEAAVVVLVLDGAEPASMEHQFRQWVAAVNAAVERCVGRAKAEEMLNERLGFATAASRAYEQDTPVAVPSSTSSGGGSSMSPPRSAPTSMGLRAAVAHRYHEHLFGSSSTPLPSSLEGGRPTDDLSAVSLLPSLVCVTKLDALERACRSAAFESNQRLLLQGFSVLQFVLHTVRRLALDARAGVLAVNARAPTDSNTALLGAVLRYAHTLQRMAAAAYEGSSRDHGTISTVHSLASKPHGARTPPPPSTGPIHSESSPSSLDGHMHYRSYTDQLVALAGNHCFLPVGFDEYRSLHSLVFTPDIATISDMFEENKVGEEEGSEGGGGGGMDHDGANALHDEVLAGILREAESSVKNVWDDDL
jgi:hypothetical protein